jgi:transcriptional regulator with PAS, ATPase and Fis domain
VHRSGPRRNQAFVAVNCAALPENLIEAELFGYVGGAYTGARREGTPGRIREADGGTLFLDEIGDMPLTMQVKLLRVLQERRFERVGGSQTLEADVRIVCATHKNFHPCVNALTISRCWSTSLCSALNGRVGEVCALPPRPCCRSRATHGRAMSVNSPT